MITEKDARIISCLRNNAREKVTKISKKVKMPATTVYDKLRAHEKKFIKKHTSLIDFEKIGYNANAFIKVEAGYDSRKEVQEFLLSNPNVNSLYKINLGNEFLIECRFRTNIDLHSFKDELEHRFKVSDVKLFSIVQELKNEEFLTRPEHLAGLHSDSE